MAQPPFESDAFQVRGDADGTRLIEAAPDGSLFFRDSQIPAGIRLSDLAGLQQTQNLLIVSPSGQGASKGADGQPLTTIQAALDAVPPGTGELTPYTILVGPGVYYEDILWTMDGVCLVALGQVVIRQLTPGSSTIRFLAGVSEVPRWGRLVGFRIENTEVGKACLELSTSTFAVGTIALTGPGVVGDSVVVAGVTLTAILATGTPLPGEFRLGTTATETAERLTQALQDPVNGLTGTVKLSVVANVITVRAALPGVGGNAITLATAQPLVYVLSGATLAGGQDQTANSLIAQSVISLEDLQLAASGAGGFPVLAESVNNLRMDRCDLRPSTAATLLRVTNCSSFYLMGCVGVPNLELLYDNNSSYLPFVTGSAYRVLQSEISQDVTARMVDLGDLRVQQTTMNSLSLSGNRTVRLDDCTIYGPVSVLEEVEFTLSRSTRGSLSGDATALVQESLHYGGLSFTASTSETYIFGYTQPDANYQVLVEVTGPLASVGDLPRVTSKTDVDFTLEFGVAQTKDVFFSVLRNL